MSKRDKVHVYPTRNGELGWTLVSRSGEILIPGSVGFTRPWTVKRSIERTRRALARAVIVHVDAAPTRARRLGRRKRVAAARTRRGARR